MLAQQCLPSSAKLCQGILAVMTVHDVLVEICTSLDQRLTLKQAQGLGTKRGLMHILLIDAQMAWLISGNLSNTRLSLSCLRSTTLQRQK